MHSLREGKGRSWSSSTSDDSKAALAAACISPASFPPSAAARGVSPAAAVDVPVRKGSVIFHHGSVVHSSGVNESATDWRIAYSSHWAAEGCTARSSILTDCARLRDALLQGGQEPVACTARL